MRETVTMIDWNQANYIDLPDLRMAYWELGTRRPDRPSVVLCHGFPELAYSWRAVMPVLADAGFHVIAVDQRGYGSTGPALSDDKTAASVELYDMAHLCDDMANLLDGLGLDKAIFCGHDFGGIMTWQLPFYHPERIAGLIGINTPFIPRLTMDPIAAFRAALGDDMYIVAFQEFGHADAKLDEDISRSLRLMFRDNGFKDDQAPTGVIYNMLTYLEKDESEWDGNLIFNSDELAYYVSGFEKYGFRAPINWYRNFSRNWQLSENFDQSIDLPSLMVCAANDAIIPPSMAEGMGKYVHDLETYTIEDCGHWTQNERPERLNNILTEWLVRRFT